MKYITFEEFEYLYSLRIPMSCSYKHQQIYYPIYHPAYPNISKDVISASHIWETVVTKFDNIQLKDEPHTKWLVP